MKRVLSVTFALLGVGLAAALAPPASAEGWTVAEEEVDPFEPSKSTFIASIDTSDGGLAIRCMEGQISLLLASSPSNATAGDPSHLKIIADPMPVREEQNAKILEATTQGTLILFGNEETLRYLTGLNLQGVTKIAIRYSAGGVVSTSVFPGGRPLADVVAKSLKACKM